MNRVYILMVLASAVYADNTTLFNDAYQAGKQNQFNMNLGQNSTISSYGQANKFESTVANNANSGTANSQTMFNNTYGKNADPNYLYNAGAQEIQNCQSKTDPRCSTLNKYGDKNTQTQIQAYNQGISQKYYISVKPDPSDSSCSTVTKKQPVNTTQASCIASAHNQNACNAVISLVVNHHDCNPNKGECTQYQNNKDCTMTKPFIAGRCNYMCDSSNHKTSNAYCPYWDDVQGGGSGGNFVWGTCQVGVTYYCSGVKQTVTCGTNAGNPSPNWNVNFYNCSPDQLASYACKSSQYSDGCAGFKK